MRIAYVTAGAAGMYCGSCLHDNTLAAALGAMGHEVALIPTYTPIRTDEDDVSIDRVFYGAINVYLEQKSPLFRATPWALDRLLDSPRLLNWVSRAGASSVNARQLGALTLSVLQGEHGRQRKELEKLVDWLKRELRPQIVHITNSMLLGLARTIREELGVPVLCSVQGEDIFLDDLVEPYRGRVCETLRDRAADVDGFLATSRYYADYMARFLGVPRETMHAVGLGLKMEGHGEPRPKEPRPFVIGYLARICPEKGLHLLIDAFRILAERMGKEQLRLRVAGYCGERDREYLDGIRADLRSFGLEGAVEIVGEVDRAQKIEFLGGLHVLSVPTVYREPKGLFVLEALANGVPVVQPRHGAFPELIEGTGGGVLVEPQSAEALADGLKTLMDDQSRASELGRRGREAVLDRHTDAVMAAETLEVYQRYLGDPG